MTPTTDPVALNQWCPVAYDGQVAIGRPRETVLLGQKVRVSMDEDGSLRCAALNEDGTPLRDLPVQEKFVLIFTTLGDAPRPLAKIEEVAEPDRRVVNCGAVGIEASPYRIVENFLDMAHFSFVHTDILGSTEQTEVFSYKTEHRKDVDEIWATECKFFQPAASKSAMDVSAGQMTDYIYRVMSPFSVVLYKSVIGYPGRMDVISLFVQPINETRCIAYPPMFLLDAESTNASMVDFQQTIFLQDRIILENQRPKMLPLATRAEMPTRADVSSVAYRRWLKSMGIRFGIISAEAA